MREIQSIITEIMDSEGLTREGAWELVEQMGDNK